MNNDCYYIHQCVPKCMQINEKIVKISCGQNFSALLDGINFVLLFTIMKEKGRVWTCGQGLCGELAQGNNVYYSFKPQLVKFDQMDNGQEIKDLECGCNHLIVLTSTIIFEY